MRTTSVVHAVDTHACGEPARVIVGGVADVPGQTMFEKMIYLKTHADNLRLRMLREPRGYPAANCNLILPPTQPEADAGFVIMEQVEYPCMSCRLYISRRNILSLWHEICAIKFAGNHLPIFAWSTL